MNAIEIKNLSKSFRDMYAVDHLNMTVPVGAIYGFIGENGSGKPILYKYKGCIFCVISPFIFLHIMTYNKYKRVAQTV